MTKPHKNGLRKIRPLLLVVVILSALSFYQIAFAQPAPTKDTKATKSTSAKTADTAPAPSDKEIADAKAKGMVWVNLASGVYHKEGKFYGKTKRGKFMSEDDAKKAGYREAKTETAKTSSKTTPSTKK